uniref:hypothetical protein n=1 Tax=Alloprevotella sp. TaxID=1872471 RepID=UPI003FF0A04C
MSDIIFNISGGNNQILPNATEAVQHFYGDQYAEKILQKETPSEPINPALEKLALYINKESLPTYIAQIGACESATELAKVVVSIAQQDSKLTPEEIVKERFIKLLLPFAPKLTKGKGIDNLRARINDAWSTRPKHDHS